MSTAHDLETRLRSRDELDRTGQAFEEGLRGSGVVSASSEGGSVSVSLDGQGTIPAITVRGSWQRECEPEALASLILTTLTEAEQLRLASALEGTEAQLDDPVRRPRLLERPDIDLAAWRGRAGDESLRSAIETIGGLRGMVADLQSSMLEAATSTHQGRSASGHARATCNGMGRLTGLELDARWLPGAHPHNIGRESVDAITNAQGEAAAHPMDQVVAQSRVGRLQRLLTAHTAIRSDQESATS